MQLHFCGVLIAHSQLNNKNRIDLDVELKLLWK
jgi:hypothetical protein